MIEFISFAIFIVLFGLSIYQIVRMKLTISKLANDLVQSQSDNSILASKLGEALASQAINENEGFVKFLSTSRDWAFEYIEDVQGKIKMLRNAMESGIDEEINSAYRDLISMIPEGESK